MTNLRSSGLNFVCRALLPIGFLSIACLARNVSAQVSLEMGRPAHESKNVPLDSSINLRFTQALDPSTLKAIQLREVGANKPVRIQYSTDLTNASVTISTISFLDAATTYELTADSKLLDVNGEAVKPFRLKFTTSSDTSGSKWTFSPETFDKTRSMTTVLFGPDQRLYAASAFGELVCWPVDSSGQPQERIVLDQDPSTSTQFIDLEWDPQARKDHLVLWVSYAQRLFEPNDPKRWYTGEIARLTIQDDKVIEKEVVITGLPHGREKQGGFDTLPHQPNGLCFKNGMLYQSVGSTSSNGGPANWGVPEQPLSACILEIDYQNIRETLDVSPFNPSFDPEAPEALVRRFATGVRNALELVAHSNGRLYTAVNINDRNSVRDGVPDSPTIPGNQTELITDRTPDHESLLIIEEGRHYGFPNPTIGNYVFAGGNPTSARDPFEIPSYPIGTQPERGFAPELMVPIWKWGGTSPNGMIEYMPKQESALSHTLLCCFYSANDIAVLRLDENGKLAQVSKLLSRTGKLQFRGPLDIAQDPKTGSLYISDFGKQSLFGKDGSMVWLKPDQ